jgi:hypothetical protein
MPLRAAIAALNDDQLDIERWVAPTKAYECR